MRRYWKGEHTRHKLEYHIVWIPKYRKRVLRGKIAIRIKELLSEGCKINGWNISKVSIQVDHIHILVQTKPKDSISSVVQMLKGGTSRIIRKEFKELKEFLWGDSFWADGYFAETVGSVNEEIVRKYIESQD